MLPPRQSNLGWEFKSRSKGPPATNEKLALGPGGGGLEASGLACVRVCIIASGRRCEWLTLLRVLGGSWRPSLCEHGPEHWFSKWERQCLAEAEQEEPSEEEAEGSQQKLWHLFQNSATAVAQLYKDRVCQQQGGLSLWVPFQNAATAVTNLYKDLLSMDFWFFKKQLHKCLAGMSSPLAVIHTCYNCVACMESLYEHCIAKYLPPQPLPLCCNKVAATLSSNSFHLKMMAELSGSRNVTIESWPLLLSLVAQYIPGPEGVVRAGLSGAMASISVRSSTPGSPTHVSGASNPSRRRNGLHDVDLNTFISEEMALHLDNGGTRKRTSAQCDVITDSPTHKRNRMI
ncbi:CP072 protein, partial [Polyodon spathula]|nr:CP072 protein [Polyodon spathula]